MRLKIASWNINSVRLRENLVLKFLHDYEPDILAIQETKCPTDLLPEENFKELGYEHIAYHGQKSYNGVLILSKFDFCNSHIHDFCNKGDARHISIKFSNKNSNKNLRGLEVHNFYIPAGGDEPNIEINPKFAHKLDFVKEMKQYFASNYDNQKDKLIILGDFNIAPYEHDVWSHHQLRNTVSHTKIEIDNLLGLMADFHWCDVMRKDVSMDEKLYSWWSYRARDWKKSNRGRRLDHIWASPMLEENYQKSEIIYDIRDWEKPSDHVPVIAEFDL